MYTRVVIFYDLIFLCGCVGPDQIFRVRVTDFPRSSWTQHQDPVTAGPERLAAADCCFFSGEFLGE